jgi:hypothetical protein
MLRAGTYSRRLHAYTRALAGTLHVRARYSRIIHAGSHVRAGTRTRANKLAVTLTCHLPVL